MGELFISVAELKRVKKQCQPRKDIYIYIYIYNKVGKKGSEEEGGGGHDMMGEDREIRTTNGTKN